MANSGRLEVKVWGRIKLQGSPLRCATVEMTDLWKGCGRQRCRESLVG
jgi:hypothetical protein